MKKLLCLIMFLTLGFSVALMGVSPLAHATTPTISNIAGTVATGQTLTISGTNMVNENKTGWISFFSSNPNAYGFEGNDFTSDGYETGTSGTGSTVGYSSAVKLLGNKSAKFHIQGQHTDTIDHNPRASADIYFGSLNPSQVWIRQYTRYDGVGWPAHYIKHWWTNFSTGAYLMTNPEASQSEPSTWLIGNGNDWIEGNIPGGALNRERWYCVELQMKYISSGVEFDLWIDNTHLGHHRSTSVGTIKMNWMEFGIINLNMTDTSFNMDHYVDNFAMSQQARIYCSSIIEIGNSSDYATATKKYQAPVTLSDGTIQIKVDLTGLGSGPYYLWITNNRQERSAAYALSGGGDTTSPTVSITAPFSGSSVSGTVTVSADASDNVGVAGVQFKLDGANLDAEDMTSPYSISWDTTIISNGSHTLTATARDAAGNETTSSVVSITVDNADTTPPAAPTGLAVS